MGIVENQIKHETESRLVFGLKLDNCQHSLFPTKPRRFRV